MNPKNINKMVIDICNKYCYPVPPKVTLNARLRECLGRCNCETKEIELNKYVVLHNPKKIIEAILKHEIVHTRHCNHTKEFQVAVKIIGSSMYVEEMYPTINLPYKYVYECPVCHGRFYHNKRIELSCGECTSTYSKKYKLKLIKTNKEIKT